MENWISRLGGGEKPIIGMVHLPPLPGNPRARLEPDEIVESALRDSRTLVENGIHSLLVENYYDSPYPKYAPREEVVGIISIVAWLIRKELGVKIGINILRNCGVAALAVAHVSGASFIRVNALSQTVVGDQGIIEPIAYDLMLKKKSLNSKIRVMADINVKHAEPLVQRGLEEIIRETIDRGGADAVVVSGAMTGMPPDPLLVDKARRISGETPLVIGSGITPENLHIYFEKADGFIVGTYFKDKNGGLSAVKIRKLVEKHRELMKTWRK